MFENETKTIYSFTAFLPEDIKFGAFMSSGKDDSEIQQKLDTVQCKQEELL